MEEHGWIKLHRKILSNPITSRPVWAWLWVFLILRANHEDKEFIWNGKPMLVKRGQMLTGLKSLKAESGVSIQSIRSTLEYLKVTRQITINSTNKWSLITIINYDQYQQVTNKEQTNNKQITTNKNDKNDKNTPILGVGVPPNPLKKEPFGDAEVNEILEQYKRHLGHAPTDKKPRNVAHNTRQRIHSFIKVMAPYKQYTFKGVLDLVFTWYMARDSMKGETLDEFKRKMMMLFDYTIAKYKKTGGDNK